MKRITILLSLIFATTALQSKEIYIKPQGDYATIDVEHSERLADQLRSEKVSWKKKLKLAAEVAENPGEFNPATLVEAGLIYLQEKDLEQATPLCIGGVYRALIDAKTSKDPTVVDTPTILMMAIGEMAQSVFNEKEKESWAAAVKAFIPHFEEWDRETSRNYDDNWIRLHSLRAFSDSTFVTLSPEEKERIREQFYLELKSDS